MTGWFSLLLGMILEALMVFLAMREISLYRRDARDRTDLVRYSKRRLKLRLGVSFCLFSEVFLIFLFPSLLRWLGPGALKGSESAWFLAYVALVLGLAVGLMVLAALDLKESGRQLERSEKQLLSELIHEVARGERPPEVH